MKTMIVRLVFVASVVAVVANVMVYQKTGRILAKDWLASATGAAKDILPASVVNQMEGVLGQVTHEAQQLTVPETVRIYTWKDADGITHYNSQPVKGAKPIDVSTKINVLPAPPKQKQLGGEGHPPSESILESLSDKEQMNAMREAMRARMEMQIQ